MKKPLLLALLALLAVAIFQYVRHLRAFNAYASTTTDRPVEGMNVPVNPEAPVRAEADILIAAPLDQVWNTLTTINDWPKWQTGVTMASLEGPPAEGSTFRWKAGGLSFSSTLHTVAPMARFGWTGRTFGAYAVHNWRLQAQDGGTRVVVEESLQGLVPALFSGKFQQDLEAGVQRNLQDLQRVCEAPAATAAPAP